ncbi:polysaccharide biosynthesis protein [Chondromyces apiculatus]|uniref:UDP-N-acetylglucosamine 4,6-dehydratase n=1 Tax=Chondromyces apiculatus DSM 436 TaxID=1192034 RepID=A0A017T1W7_9BACT|nr:nucleoside-diphosphate sugar epimerase/dehydratase [Chondromyces apiculatus]EYF03259.1 UDP-N-acetylglucosamine 4,6-dehydratase [Chondromyces apiculatus DSM 436]
MKKAWSSSILRRAAIVLIHALLWTAAFHLALQLRFEGGAISEPFARTWPYALGLLLVCRAVAFYAGGLFHGLWRYAGLPELLNLIKTTTAGSVAFVVLATMAGVPMPRSLYVGEWLASIVLVGGLRFAIRLAHEQRQGRRRHPDALQTLILGAGDAGESLLRDIQRMPDRRWEVCGFLDDDPLKRGALVRDVRVLGGADEATLRRVVVEREVKLVLLAMPTVDGPRTRDIVRICQKLEVPVRTVPSISERIEDFSVATIREVAIEDLLRRAPVSLDVEQVEGLLEGRTVLVTGAGGSIGGELCRQALRFKPGLLLLLDHSENGLYFIERELRQRFPEASVVPLVCDITDRGRLDALFRRYRPEVVIHAAAHKHVPMMEANSPEAVKNNVFGTVAVADAAHASGADTFVMISTDKAVNPTSIMGATKRVAEMALQARAEASRTRYVTVRFGNVLASTGSVVPLFREQIARGGPVTVTHPEMRRYFMTIPEATQLVLQAGAIAERSEIFVLDMGEPVRIVDLARDMIELSGFTPDVDIKVEFVGLRPGEKLFEELLLDDERYARTPHPKIRVGKIQPTARERLERGLSGLRAAADANDDAAVRRFLAELVPESTLSPPEAATVSAPALSPAPSPA